MDITLGGVPTLTRGVRRLHNAPMPNGKNQDAPVALVSDRPGLRAAIERALRGGPGVSMHPVEDWLRGQASAAGERLVMVDIPAARAIHQMLAVADHWPGGFPGSLMAVLAQDVASVFNPHAVVDGILVEPFSDAEVAMRVRHLLWQSRMDETPELLSIGELTLDTAKYEVTVAGKPLNLALKEYELLRFLATHPGRVFTREMLLTHVWGDDYYGGARTVDVHIRRLRLKLGPRHEGLIATVRNVGYRFET